MFRKVFTWMPIHYAMQSKEDENIVDKASDAVKNVTDKVKEAAGNLSGNAAELAGKVQRFRFFLFKMSEAGLCILHTYDGQTLNFIMNDKI